MGVTGGNFLVAETESVAVVTNEGMCTVMPRVHVAVTGIEKILPTLEDLAIAMRLLPRSATGQTTSNYFSLLTGLRAPGRDGRAGAYMYFVLVDGRRAGLIGGEFQEMLRYIRCGACMNHCPVYQKIGGHAYGWVYPGPMGSVLTPAYMASTRRSICRRPRRCAASATACARSGFRSPICCASCARKADGVAAASMERTRGATGGGYLAMRPTAYALFTKLAVRVLERMGGHRKTRSRVCRSARDGRARAICLRRSAARSVSCTRRRAPISADAASRIAHERGRAGR